MAAKLLLSGYFGCGNLGDDAMLLGFLHGIEGRPYEVRVLCGDEAALMRNYGLQGVQRLDLRAVRNAIEASDALVFAGGSIFQDVTSVRSVVYYARLAREAKKAGKKVVMLGQGVGPLRRFLGKRFAVSAFQHADAIVVRDPGSVRTLAELGVKATPRLASDLAFLMPTPPKPENSSEYAVGNMKTVGVSARPYRKDRARVVKLFGDLVRLLYQANYVPVLLEMDRMEDGPIITEICKQQGGKVPEMRGLSTPMQVQQRLGRMESVIAMRLHAGILAATAGVPPYLISYDPKVSEFARSLGYSSPPIMPGLTAERIMDGFLGFVKDREKNAEALQRKREDIVKLARTNIDVLAQCLGE